MFVLVNLPTYFYKEPILIIFKIVSYNFFKCSIVIILYKILKELIVTHNGYNGLFIFQYK